MAKSLTWVFELIDKMSAPAHAAAKAVEATAKALDKTVRASRSSRVATTGTGLAIKEMGTAGVVASFGVGKASKALEHMSVTQQQFSSGLAYGGMAINGWLESIGKVGSVVFGVGKFAVEAQAFKEDTLVGLKVVLGTQEKANEVMEDAKKWASQTPFKTSDAERWTKDLITRRTPLDEVSTWRTALGDLSADNPAGMDTLVRAVGNMNGIGRMTGDFVAALNDNGLPQGDLFKQLAKQYNTTPAMIPKLMDMNRIDSGSATTAAWAAIAKNEGGMLGTMLKERSHTLTGLWSTATSRPEELSMGIGGKGMTRMKAALENINDVLDPDSATGNKIIASMTKLQDMITKFFIEPFTGPDGAKRLTEIIDGVTSAVELLGKALKVLGVIHEAAWYPVTLVGKIAGGMQEAGGQAQAGFIEGLLPGAGITRAMVDLAAGGVDAFKGKLDSHSPSRVFEEIGFDVTAGFEQGVRGGSGDASAAVESMVKVPSARGSGRGVTLAPGSVVVNIDGGSGQEIETKVRDAVMQALASAFEQFGLEAGVA